MRRTYSDGLASPVVARPGLEEELHPQAVWVCAIGFFLRIMLSGPALNGLGITYGSDDGSLLAKIHPGSYFIFLSFLMLVFSRGNPFEQLIRIARQQTAFFVFLSIYVLIIIGWLLRGPKGVGLILDVHIVAPMMAIVFSYAPRSYCRKIVYLFAGFAILNSATGLVEAATHTRLFAFDPEWEVLNQDYFRASAFLGHPLANAIFTALALFVILDLRLPSLLKAAIFLMMLASLVAFGGRAALGVSIAGLTLYGLIEIKNRLWKTRLTVMQLIASVGAILIAPVICFGMLHIVLHSGIGERLLAYNSLSDDSANTRLMIFRVFDNMDFSTLFFGNDGDQLLAIATQAGLDNPTSDIESPWILMLLFLGLGLFTLWFCGWGLYVWRLMAGAPLAAKFTVIEYFIIASTSNSFGRKDLLYASLAGIVVCMKRMQGRREDSGRE